MASGIQTQLNMDAEIVTFTLVHLYHCIALFTMVHIVSFVIDDFNATTIVLTNVATAAIVFCLGVVTGAVMCICYRKLQCGIRRKQRIPPKDIELRDNPAYGPIKQRRQ